MSAKGFESLSTEHAAKLEAQKKVEKMVTSKELSSQARSEFESKATANDAAAFAKAMGASTAKRPVGRPPKSSSATATSQSPEHEARLRQTEALARYSRYFNSKHPKLREACAGIAPNAKWSAEEAESHLDRVRAALAEDAADETFKSGIITAARGAEWVTMKLGVNPVGLDLNEFGDFMEHVINEDKLEPEMSEGRAECGSLLTAPWQGRLVYKFIRLSHEFSESKKRAASSSLAPPQQLPSSKRAPRLDKQQPVSAQQVQTQTL
jgi:hypothetical protein